MNYNEIRLSGIITDVPKFSHTSYNEDFYLTTLTCIRSSGTADEIPLIVSEKLLCSEWYGKYFSIVGSIRTRNEDGHVNTTVFVDSVDMLNVETENTIDINEVCVVGYICKKNPLRKTPLGRTICDVTIAVNRPYGKSDYIPCVVWGRNASYIDSLQIGDEVEIEGRLQSRKYIKNNKEYTVYELSVQTIAN